MTGINYLDIGKVVHDIDLFPNKHLQIREWPA